MSLFKAGPPPHQTMLAMVGVKPGAVAVVLGADDGDLAAALADITGLNGRTLVVDPDRDAEGRVAAAAARVGRLVDFARTGWTALPVGDGEADVSVVHCQLGSIRGGRDQILSEAVRVIRPGGRVVVIEGQPKKGMLGRWTSPAGSEPLAAAEIVRLVEGTGLRAVRILGEENGVTFVEGVKPRPAADAT
jgi:ubiquinone/menaquinone biosynthesis C-methylase UbiE